MHSLYARQYCTIGGSGGGRAGMGASVDEELAFATACASEATPGFAADADPDAITGAEAGAVAEAVALPVAEAG